MNIDNNLTWFQNGCRWHNLRLILRFWNVVRFWILWLRFWSFIDEKYIKKTKRSLIYNGLEQFVDYWVMPFNYKFIIIGLNMSITDDVCKLGSVCNALPPVPWSQSRSETKEHFIGWCCQPSKYSILRFFFFPSFLWKKKTHFLTNYYETKHSSSLAYKVVTLQHFLKISLQHFHKLFFCMKRIFGNCIATFQFLNHWPFSFIFTPTNFTFLFYMFFNFCDDGLAGRER